MCEKRSRKIKKGSQVARLREARRLQRLQRMSPPSTSEDSTSPSPQPVVDKHAQSRVIIEIAWKTVALMHKNRLIQQKIVALQKETSEFIAQVMKNSENKTTSQPLHLYGLAQREQMLLTENNLPLEVKPSV